MNKFDQKTLSAIVAELEKAENVLITTHYNPDGDAIGSSMALYQYLQAKGHNVQVIIPNDVPQFLHWMPGLSLSVIYYHNPQLAESLLNNADLIFCLDYNSYSRVNLYSDKLAASKAKKILIDHHPEPVIEQFDYMLSVINVSSTSELIFDFIAANNDQDLITKEIGSNIYAGMMTDTGSFSYASNYPHTLETVAKLIKKGVDTEKIHRLIYDTYSENRMRLLGFSLSMKLVVLQEYCTAYIYLTRQDLETFSFQPGDTEGIVNYALAIKNVSFAALFTEKRNCIRISFRSKANFSVNDFARKHYQGGGHKNAAGGDSYLSMEETIKQFNDLLPEYQQVLVEASKQSSEL